MDPIERLTAIEEIKQLKARYFRCMDMKDWDGQVAVFTPDVEVDVSGEMGPGENGVIRGAQEFVTFNRGHIEHVLTVHHGHMPEIEITSDTTATGIWAMEDMLQLARRRPDAHAPRLRPLPRDLREARRRVAHQDDEAHPPPPRRRPSADLPRSDSLCLDGASIVSSRDNESRVRVTRAPR